MYIILISHVCILVKVFDSARFLHRGKCAPSPQGERALSSVEFFENLSRFAGVSEALAEREPADEILSASEGSQAGAARPASPCGCVCLRTWLLQERCLLGAT